MKQHYEWTDHAKVMMKNLGISYAEMGNRMGMGKSTIGQKLNEQRKTSVDEITKIAEILDISLSELLTGRSIHARNEGEINLLEGFRELSKRDKSTLMRFINSF